MMTDLNELERRLWAAADALRANSSLTPAEYRGPVLGRAQIDLVPIVIDKVCAELHAGQGTALGSLSTTLEPLLAESSPV